MRFAGRTKDFIREEAVMNTGIAVVTDTNSGISQELADEQEIYQVPMPIIVDGEVYFEGSTIEPSEFYSRLRNGADVKTSQPSPGSLTEMWESLLSRYDELLYIPMSSGLSESCNTARVLAGEYGGRVHVVDNHRISATLRQSLLEARYLADHGRNAEEIVHYLEQDAFDASIYIAVNTLKYLKQSGRVTSAGAAVGTVLQIKPVLQIQGGKLDAYKKVRGMKAAAAAIIEGLRQDREERFRGQPVTIRAAYTGDEELGEQWRRTLQKAFPDLLVGKDPLSLSIACHIGEGAVGGAIMRDMWSAVQPLF